MNTSMLEARLEANPKSPLFARLASNYLEDGRIEEALALCSEGVKHFPEYSTARLVLGRCYEALGRNVEALLEYRRVLKAVPDNPRVLSLVERIEKREQEAFQLFAEERVRKLKDKRGSISMEEFVSGRDDGGTPGGTTARDTRSDSSSGAASIVTATLAEIYASQGEFEEAIQAYKRLLKERPEHSDRFSRRITELEERFRAKQEEARG